MFTTGCALVEFLACFFSLCSLIKLSMHIYYLGGRNWEQKYTSYNWGVHIFMGKLRQINN